MDGLIKTAIILFEVVPLLAGILLLCFGVVWLQVQDAKGEETCK